MKLSINVPSVSRQGGLSNRKEIDFKLIITYLEINEKHLIMSRY